MSPVTVFYANMVYEEADKWIPTRDLPDGAYIYITTNSSWHIVLQHGATPINLSDVPKALRALQLILQ